MSRLFGGHGFVPASSIGAVPEGIYCALCSGSVDMFGRVHVASMRAVCGYCVRADGADTEILASRLAALDKLDVAVNMGDEERGAGGRPAVSGTAE